MFNRSVFSKRFKLVRTTYKFTIIEFASYFEVVSKTTVGAWEKETIIPSADVLADLSSFFGISLDWFAGFSDVPYTETSIENAEKNVFSKLKEADRAKIFLAFFPKEYLDCTKRSQNYSLPVRANIIVLLHCSYIPYIEGYWNVQDKKQPSSFFDNVVQNFTQYFSPSSPHYRLPTQKQLEYYEALGKLIKRKIQTPIYDIESSNEK